MTDIACLRCSSVATIVVSDDAGMAIDGTADVEHGMLAYICQTCMTEDEILMNAKKSAVTLLDAAEETIAGMKMIFERIPAFKDDPRFKEQYAQAEKMATQARSALAALMGE